MSYWKVYFRGEYVCRVWARDRDEALLLARGAYGLDLAYHVTRDCEGQ